MSHIAWASWLVTLTLVASQASQPIPATRQISGRVLDDALQPLANARVFLYPSPFPVGGRPASTVTSLDGEYSFRNLDAGAYRVGTNKPGYFPTSGAEKLITLTGPDERVSLDLTMSKGGTLAGRVVDQSGSPLKNILVGALRVTGSPELEDAEPSIGTARTNERGEYRVESLKPGAHVVIANPRQWSFGLAGEVVTEARVFFPGTLDFAQAQRVAVGPAQTVAGLDFKMVTAPTFEVSGIAVDETGRAVPGALVALEADWRLFGGTKGTSWTDPEGRFLIPRALAGRYRLTVTNPGVERTPVTLETPFIRLNVVDAAVAGLVVPVPIR